MGRQDRSAVLAVVRQPGSHSLRRIAARTGLDVRSVHGHVAVLAAAGVVTWTTPRCSTLDAVPDMTVTAARRQSGGAAA